MTKYLLFIYKTTERKSIIFVGIFNKLKEIIEYTQGLISYHDILREIEPRKYKTYKNLFQVIKKK